MKIQQTKLIRNKIANPPFLAGRIYFYNYSQSIHKYPWFLYAYMEKKKDCFNLNIIKIITIWS